MDITVLVNIKSFFVSVAGSLSRHWPGSSQSMAWLLSNSQPPSSFSSSDLELQTSQSNSSPNNTTSQSQSHSPQPHSEPSDDVNLQPQLPSATPQLPASTIDEPRVNNTLDLEVELQKMLLNFCSTVAIQITIQYEQIAQSKGAHSFNWLIFATLFTFAAMFVSRSIEKKCPKTSKALQKAGIIVAAASFVFTLTIPFPMSVKFATWAIFALTFLTIVICNCF